MWGELWVVGSGLLGKVLPMSLTENCTYVPIGVGIAIAPPLAIAVGFLLEKEQLRSPSLVSPCQTMFSAPARGL